MGGVAAGTMWAWAKGHCELEGNEAADAGASVGKTGKTNAVAVGPVLRDHNQVRQQWRQRWQGAEMHGPLERAQGQEEREWVRQKKLAIDRTHAAARDAIIVGGLLELRRRC